jgi:hypothetical protein
MPVACDQAGPDELSQIGLAADLVPDEPQPSQGFLDQPALGGSLACQRSVVGLRVMADQGGVHDGDPPHRRCRKSFAQMASTLAPGHRILTRKPDSAF